jgi:hypothetical protein
MKNEITKMIKLTPAQAYAAQVRADRRSAALERRGSVIAADNARINELFKKEEVAPKIKVKKIASKKVRWTSKEFDLIINLYLKHVDGVNGVENRAQIEAEFGAVYPTRTGSAVALCVCQIKGLDTYHPAEGMKDTSQMLIDKLYAINPERFPGGAKREEKVLNALDALLADIRA